VDDADIDYVCANIVGTWSDLDEAIFKDLSCDMDGDLEVDYDDVIELVTDILGTQLGDADLNMVVDCTDYNTVLSNLGANGGWAMGNFNCDDIIDTDDLAFAAPAVNLVSAVSRRNHGAQENQDIPIDPSGTAAGMDVNSEPREGGVQELRLTFSGALCPSVLTVGPGLVQIESQTTANPGYAGYTGAGMVTGVALEDADTTLVLTMSGFEDAATYRFTLNGATNSPQSIEVRMLAGDCDDGLGSAPGIPGPNPSTYGAVNEADKVFLFANWGGFSQWADIRLPFDSAVDEIDKTLLFARWGATAP
jgi:hypothetical protein